jgi:hypothetical protein
MSLPMGLSVMEMISTIIGVIVGFLLSSVWEYWKDSRTSQIMGKSVRSLVMQEVNHNAQTLITARDATKSTGEDTTTELGKLTRFQGKQLSQDAWTTQLTSIHLAFTVDEITSLYRFYGHLRSTAAAADRFHSFDSDGGPRGTNKRFGLLDRVMNEISEAIAAIPKFKE